MGLERVTKAVQIGTTDALLDAARAKVNARAVAPWRQQTNDKEN